MCAAKPDVSTWLYNLKVSTNWYAKQQPYPQLLEWRYLPHVVYSPGKPATHLGSRLSIMTEENNSFAHHIKLKYGYSLPKAVQKQ